MLHTWSDQKITQKCDMQTRTYSSIDLSYRQTPEFRETGSVDTPTSQCCRTPEGAAERGMRMWQCSRQSGKKSSQNGLLAIDVLVRPVLYSWRLAIAIRTRTHLPGTKWSPRPWRLCPAFKHVHLSHCVLDWPRSINLILPFFFDLILSKWSS